MKVADLFLADNSAIMACATGRGPAALALLRFSGTKKELSQIIKQCFSFSLEKLTSRRSSCRKLIYNEEILDEAVVCYFEGPSTFTGEDVLEVWDSKAFISTDFPNPGDKKKPITLEDLGKMIQDIQADLRKIKG